MDSVQFKLSGSDCVGGYLEVFFMLFSDKAEGCTAVREAFLLLLSHCGGGREGGKEMAIFIWQWCGRQFVVFMLV